MTQERPTHPMAPLGREHDETFSSADFEDFWDRTLAQARGFELSVRIDRIDSPVKTIDVFDVSFSGFQGEEVKGWLRRPRGRPEQAAAVVEFVGYGNGRGEHIDNLLWSSAGYAHLTMDTRGQGSVHSPGHTADSHGSGPSVPGFASRGLTDPAHYYYRRLIVDAVRAVDAMRSLDGIDPSRVALFGASQGGGVALAVAGLVPDLAAVVAKVPFLCDIPRALALAESGPYMEIVEWLGTHVHREQEAMRALSYVDAVNFGPRATAPALFSAGLRDTVCPAPTVSRAFDAYAGGKELRIWKYGGHSGGGSTEDLDVLRFLDTHLGGQRHRPA
ncbi:MULTISPECIES: acetylxylan esterase [unclassified Streptomyces]|uniref:acetylxylan esterase n=1 Tax=unclassified Streptomyces TaxID=2593676 RepID=UPI000938E5C3|nr:acetylxylan esterase [Streptomyces sp. TSRI0281]